MAFGRRYTTEDEAAAEWGDLSVEEKLDKIAEHIWPELFIRPPKAPPAPTERLYEPWWEGYDEAALQTRFNALSRGCWALDEWEKRQAAWEEYYTDCGQNLPARYITTDDRVIEQASGADLTDLIPAKNAVTHARSDWRALPDDDEHYAEEKAELWEKYQDALDKLAEVSGYRRERQEPPVPKIPQAEVFG